ncbi:MAG: DNA-processing protein DprA [Polyangiaceae bacterium]|nr:DNA-processing protein DprA [Polyangiaceae bacterium]
MLAALALSRRPGVGAASFKGLLAEHGSPRRALEAYDARARMPSPRPKAALVEGLARARAYLEAGGFLTYLGAPGYPSALAELGEPPPLLFVRGRPEALAGPLIALVGARAADDDALAETHALAALCAQAGVGVVSGGALGVDAAAHEGALAAGGVTAALLGCGVDVVYPPAHGELFARIVERGALASELAPGTEPRATFFPTRNRLVAGVARAAVVVRGGAKSGALITARWARRLGRPLFVLRARPDDPLGEANRALAAAGAIELAEPAAIAPWLAAIAGGAAPQSFKISRAAL